MTLPAADPARASITDGSRVLVLVSGHHRRGNFVMAAVLCVTLNACLDKTLVVPEWRPGDNVRGLSVREVVGGKGNNVARALRRLGVRAEPATFLGGATGQRCRALLTTDDGFDPVIVETGAQTRTILTVRTGETAAQTAFFDPDPSITTDEAAALLAVVASKVHASDVSALTLSGSSPAEPTHGVFAELVEIARRAGVSVLMDTYGPALRHASGSVPDVVQLNRREVAGALGVSPDRLDETEVFAWLAGWISRGTRLAIVTQGPEAVLAASEEGFWRVTVPTIEPVNPIGSGDSVMAGLCHGLLKKDPIPAMLKFAVACGVANALVWDAGAIELPAIAVMSEHVDVHQVRFDAGKIVTNGGA